MRKKIQLRLRRQSLAKAGLLLGLALLVAAPLCLIQTEEAAALAPTECPASGIGCKITDFYNPYRCFTNSGPTAGYQLQLADCAWYGTPGANRQYFRFEYTGGVFNGMYAYRIRTVNSNNVLCLDNKSSTSNNAAIVQNACLSGYHANQQFLAKPYETGYKSGWQFISRNTSKLTQQCISTRYNATYNRTYLVQANCVSGAYRQTWHIDPLLQ